MSENVCSICASTPAKQVEDTYWICFGCAVETCQRFSGSDGLLERTYRALHRQEWETGETEAELAEAIHDWGCNNYGPTWPDLPQELTQ